MQTRNVKTAIKLIFKNFDLKNDHWKTVLGIISVLKAETFDRNDKNVFLLLNSHETEVHLSVQKASDRIFSTGAVQQGFMI